MLNTFIAMHEAERAKFKTFDASNYRVGIVAAQFNLAITEALLAEALRAAKIYNIPDTQIQIYRVAGSVEIPLILEGLAETHQYDCLVALGAVIRGETPHFDYVAKIVSEGVLRVMLDFEIPIGFGILTSNNIDQARKRISAGGAALEAALQNAKLLKAVKKSCLLA